MCIKFTITELKDMLAQAKRVAGVISELVFTKKVPFQDDGGRPLPNQINIKVDLQPELKGDKNKFNQGEPSKQLNRCEIIDFITIEEEDEPTDCEQCQFASFLRCRAVFPHCLRGTFLKHLSGTEKKREQLLKEHSELLEAYKKRLTKWIKTPMPTFLAGETRQDRVRRLAGLMIKDLKNGLFCDFYGTSWSWDKLGSVIRDMETLANTK